MLSAVYALTGALLCSFAWLTWRDRSHPRRGSTALFWLLLGVVFMGGDFMPSWVSGLLVLWMVGIDAFGGVARSSHVASTEPEGDAQCVSKDTDWIHNARHPQLRLGRRVFWPVVLIPAVTFVGAAAHPLLRLDASHGALVGLAAGGVLAAAAVRWLAGCSWRDVLDDGRRLNETMGAVNILPQLLASLGVLFTVAGIGDMLAAGVQSVVPAHNLFALVLADCLTMAAFTFLMGNSFAAMPVIATGILVPLLVRPFGVPAEMAAIITLTAGSSGTLMTPMAANFNMVPAALLEMRDTYGVVKFQLPFAAVVLTGHVVLMYLLCVWLATPA
jgi:uncharacterized membrane protein